MFSEWYVRFILALAPFVVCLAFSLERELWRGERAAVWLLSATLFAAGVLTDRAAVWGSVPWLAATTCLALYALVEWARRPALHLPVLARLFGMLYLPVGAVWALFAQLEWRPLGFSSIIVLLTGVHFHYAGFALPTLTGLWLKRARQRLLFKAATVGVILGVPLVAVGITTSQLKLPFWIETGAVTVLALSAFVVSAGQGWWSLSSGSRLPRTAKVLLVAGSVALATGMALAVVYGWRHVFPLAWVSIPAMYAFHGTLNSLGFCLPGFLAWKLVEKKEKSLLDPTETVS